MDRIDWRATQKLIGAGVDGIPGRETYGRLFAFAAGRVFTSDPAFERLGLSAAANFRAYGVADNMARILALIAETCHETRGFAQFEERLSYSAQRLAEVWPGRYAVDPKGKVKTPNARAKAVAGRPQALAADTYGLRIGNQPASSDNDTHEDGWQYRGRGPTMLTGKANYEAMGKTLGLPLVTDPDLAGDPYVGLLIALEFYQQRGVFAAADRDDLAGERRAVQGGTLGMDEVLAIKSRLRRVLRIAA